MNTALLPDFAIRKPDSSPIGMSCRKRSRRDETVRDNQFRIGPHCAHATVSEQSKVAIILSWTEDQWPAVNHDVRRRVLASVITAGGESGGFECVCICTITPARHPVTKRFEHVGDLRTHPGMGEPAAAPRRRPASPDNQSTSLPFPGEVGATAIITECSQVLKGVKRLIRYQPRSLHLSSSTFAVSEENGPIICIHVLDLRKATFRH